MSDARRGKGGESRGRDGGSVRRARERMEAGERGIRPLEDVDPARSSKVTSQGPSSTRRPPPAPIAFKTLDNAGKAAVISKPSPAPQWPLRDESARSRKDRLTANETVNFSKRPAPQRPARPDNIPSLLDASKIRDYTPSIPYRQGRAPSSFQQPQNNTSLPDTKIAQPTPAATVPPVRGNPNTHPPPSTRRTGSSYYSSTAFVSPIPEEPPENIPRKGGSYASSKVIPSSWGTAPPDSDIPKWSDEDFLNDGDDKPSDSLVRQASLGKRGKASLCTINRVQSDQSVDGNQASKLGTNKNSNENVETVAIGMAISANSKVVRPADKDKNILDQPKPRPSDDYTSSISSDDEYEKPPIPIMRFESNPSKPSLKIENRRSNVLPGSNGRKRPPQIDIDAVRRAEARGSLTSLPELIRRATRLASNLDRGKTASRLGMSDMLNTNDDHRGRNSGSISDILASFPPPAIATPVGGDRWPGTVANSERRSQSDAEKGPKKSVRRCCGLPLWAVILICLISLALISIAVIIPVTLTILPRPAQPSSEPPAETCQGTDPCMNGGISVGNPGSCGCVCVDGFGGDRCAVAGDNSCTTVTVSNESSGFQNATLGTALVRLFEDSQANFSIPLDTPKILRLFSRESVSCTSQNALVTFNGASRKRSERTISQPDTIHGGAEDTSPPSPTTTRKSIRNRNTRNHVLFERQAINRDPHNPTTRSSIAPSATSTNSPSLPTLSAKVLDFSRIAVLFIFEETEDLADAVSAHDSIQSFLQDPAGESARQMGSMGVHCASQDFALDFIRFTIRLDNGTVVGGT